MILDIPRDLDDAYTGAGVYLAALEGDTIRALERIGDAEAIRAFADRHPGLRVVAAVGSCHQLIVTPDDCSDLRWSAEQARDIWRARDVLLWAP